ncbi:methylmalonate-semialdehyde dehydrogenase (CoA acylating) [Candidatus Marinamargulisbacteria bacterium SCGC AG-343-D04]|nr:methylmalonate-semialdehyde dehydrogenase (CoA acylating) [Candidatus Marinamargulisbacteria bacterium SCGC AG-343-D04]
MAVLTDETVQNITSPINGEILDTTRLYKGSELDAYVQRAKNAYKAWGGLTLRERAQFMYRYRELMIARCDELAQLVHQENGKTLGEARAEVEKSIEVTEFACSLPQIAKGDQSEVSRGVFCQQSIESLGVVANITPSNFPHMVPHWTLAISITLGNTLIIKPSERVPLSMLKSLELLKEAGLPEDVVQVLPGRQDLVEAICDHPDIKAVSFVGSTKVAQIVYQRCSQNLKRVIGLGGAKNHILVLPDAHTQMSATNIAASMTGCAGQRCMAASVMVGVNKVDHIISSLIEECKKIIPGENLGAIISKDAKARIETYIQEAIDQGATCVLDGRNPQVEGKEGGYYVGPTILDNVRPDMALAKEEVFGPVLAIIRTESLEDAIEIENNSEYGNGAAIFTQSGPLAKKVAQELSAGMIGVNIGVPVPREPYSFGGWNDSKFGVGDITGESSIGFWTQLKKTTTKWNPEAQINWMS